ncbi:MAG: hypothetical protein JWQ28_140 [Pedobacter sp.]|jgi:hypothetical protein|nr:hypothetical protein [Pedobacter sp.]
MGIAKYGILGPVSGKVGNLVFYVSKGKACIRTAGTRLAPLTPAELINTNKMAVLMSFFKHVKPFIKLGFAEGLAHSNYNYHNAATSYNKKNALALINGKVELAYNRIRLSNGTGLEAEQALVKLVGNELHFSWKHQEENDWDTGSDQVMIMAFFPDENLAIYEVAGAKRKAGFDILPLHASLVGKRMELYIAFIAQDRQRVSNSLYLGRLN